MGKYCIVQRVGFLEDQLNQLEVRLNQIDTPVHTPEVIDLMSDGDDVVEVGSGCDNV